MNTPGPGGYLLAIVISWLTFLVVPLLIAVAMGDGGLDPDGIIFSAVVVVGAGIPVGALGATIVHLTCYHQPRQWVHVLAAGGSALLIEAAFVALVGDGPAGLVDPVALVLFLPMPASAMAGRAAVIPLVHARVVHRPESSPAAHRTPH